jgi:hypothetical protein
MVESGATAQFYARLAGGLYLLTNLSAIFAFMMRGKVLHLAHPAQSVKDIAATPLLLRLSIVGELVTIAGVLVLVASLFVMLRKVDPHWALVALLWRLAENGVLAWTALNEAALLIASDVESVQTSAQLVHLFGGLYGAGYLAGFFFLGLGSTLFSWIWWRSRWIPRLIAGWGVAASAVMAVASLAILAMPNLRAVIGMVYMAPMGLYEFGLGLWLLIKGINQNSGIEADDRQVSSRRR